MDVAVAVRSTAYEMAAVGVCEDCSYELGPVTDHYQAVMLAAVSVPIVPSVVIVPLRVYPLW
jgi:hypothetical protein